MECSYRLAYFGRSLKSPVDTLSWMLDTGDEQLGYFSRAAIRSR